MTGEQALAELLDVSEDVVAAVIFDSDGKQRAATVVDSEATRAAEIAAAMLAYAAALRTGVSPTRLEAVTVEGSVFVLRERTGAIVAVTGRDSVAGLVLHDLRTTLGKMRRGMKAKASASS